MGTGIKRVQAALVVLMLAILGFLGTQPASATDTTPVPETTNSPNPDPGETFPPVVLPPVLDPGTKPDPLEPQPSEPAPVVPPVEPAPAPVAPPVVEPVAPVVVPTIAPADPTTPDQPTDVGTEYVEEPEAPAEETTTAPAEPTPTPTPTTTAAPPVVSADITGPLKVALAPVAENNPLVQGVTVLVLLLLGVAYFRALRSKGIRGPRLNGK
ncbi:hypothetical protein ACIQC5_01040 [Paenarthrobacter sp. NPDC092416]|uniref:hypothetical protein n=1 Tax=Paenarthrobacter sp. NPDC092416 TaxID=3364386 RepID=UPI00381AF921